MTKAGDKIPVGEEMPEEVWLGFYPHGKLEARYGECPLGSHPVTTSYTRTDLIETLKKSPLEHGKLEEVGGYPTTLTGKRTSFTGDVVTLTADEVDLYAETYFQGKRLSFKLWLTEFDEELVTKGYDEQLRYKTDIAARLTLQQRRFKR